MTLLCSAAVACGGTAMDPSCPPRSASAATAEGRASAVAALMAADRRREAQIGAVWRRILKRRASNPADGAPPCRDRFRRARLLRAPRQHLVGRTQMNREWMKARAAIGLLAFAAAGVIAARRRERTW